MILEAGYNPSEFIPVCDVKELNLYVAFSRDTPDEVIYCWQNILDQMKLDGRYRKITELWLPSLISRAESTGEAVDKVAKGSAEVTLLNMFDASYFFKKEGILHLLNIEISPRRHGWD